MAPCLWPSALDARQRRRVQYLGKPQSMPQVLESLWRQVCISVALFRFRAVQLAGSAAFLITVLATALAPDTSPSEWDWTRMLLILGTATVAMLCFLASRDRDMPSETQQLRLFAAALLVTVSLLFNVTFGVGTAIAFSIGFTLVAMLAQADIRGRSPWLLCGAIAIIIPFWVWTALEAWHIGLLMLVPLGAIALISDGHMRDAVLDEQAKAGAPTAMSSRGHRLASWLGILAAALLLLIAGLPGDSSSSWLVLGALGAVVCVALEAGLPRLERMTMARRSVLLGDLAFAWIAVCWLASL